jgi:hypothetical protein
MSDPRSRTLEGDKQGQVMENKSQGAQGDTRFVPEVQHHKGAYISIEDCTKEHVSFKPKPSELPPRSTWFSTMNPQDEEGNTNFPELNHKLGIS